ASATRRGRYAIDVGDPLTATVSAWTRRITPSMTSRGRGARGESHGPPRDAVKARLLRLHVALAARFGAQHWWPGRTPFEVAAGAILTQHTAWTNAARAVAALRARGLLRPE